MTKGYTTLGLQVPPQKVFGPSKPTPSTFSEGATGAQMGKGQFTGWGGCMDRQQSSTRRRDWNYHELHV